MVSQQQTQPQQEQPSLMNTGAADRKPGSLDDLAMSKGKCSSSRVITLFSAVDVQSLIEFWRSKHDLYKYQSQHKQALMPPERATTCGKLCSRMLMSPVSL